MVIGKIVLDCLRDKKKMLYDSEDIRRFNIGLLSIGTSKLCLVRRIVSFFSLSDSYIIGYYLQKFINENKTEINLNNDVLNDNMNNSDNYFESKYQLALPEVKPYFSTPCGIYLNDYMDVYYNYKNCKINRTINNVEKLEKKFIGLAYKFYKTNRFRIRKGLRKRFVKNKRYIKWSSDNTKNNYYRKRWNYICNEAYKGNNEEISNLNIFFDGLIEELNNILAQSDKMCIGWNWDEKLIIFSSTAVTILNAIVATVSASNDESNDCLHIVVMVFAVLATTVSAINSAFSLFKNHHGYRETWLRHQLNYSRFTAEIENFCECIGDYKIESNLTNIQDKYKDNINKFQTRIAELRKIDYKNFFTNMDCINFNDNKPK